MQAVRVLTSTGVPLRRSDVDTDQIIPSDWLKQVSRTGFGKGLFSEWRDEPSFVLNDEQYTGASILVSGPNFGTGSSREHAVWALMDYGFQAVISPRFGDIFRNNSTKNGLVPVQVDAELVERIQAAIEGDPETAIVVDVERRVVEVPSIDLTAAFPMDDATQERFLEGLDDVGISLRSVDAIDTHEAARPAWLPSL
ncbi:MAG: 3-isopropylmalate dehydratase small subunit [Actinomycetota bacterium]